MIGGIDGNRSLRGRDDARVTLTDHGDAKGVASPQLRRVAGARDRGVGDDGLPRASVHSHIHVIVVQLSDGCVRAPRQCEGRAIRRGGGSGRLQRTDKQMDDSHLLTPHL